MALLKTKFLYNLASRSLSTGKVLGAGYWNRDWKPGPYPKTEEERKAAAKKYGLMDVEYKPIDDDGNGAGDYPDFKKYSVEERDQHYPWDYPEYRRNFNEPMHSEFIFYTEDRSHCTRKERWSDSTMLACFFGFMGGVYILCELAHDSCFLPTMPRHLSGQGVTHYKYPQSEHPWDKLSHH